MNEVVPITVGLVIGLLIQKVQAAKARIAMLVILCTIFGALASYISGELNVSWGFLTIDAALVWLGACIAVVLVALWMRRRTKVSVDR